MVTNVNAKIFAGFFILLMISVSLATAIPVVSPPTVITPVTQVQVPGQKDKISDSTETVSDSVVSSSLNSAVGGSWQEVGEIEINVADFNKNTQSVTNGMSSAADLKAGSFKFVKSMPFKRYWTGNQGYYWSYQLFNANNAATNTWKAVMTAPYNNLDLYLYRKVGSSWQFIKKSTGSTSNEQIQWTVYHGNYYKWIVYRAGGAIGTYTATVKLYAWVNSNPPTPGNTEIINAHQYYRNQVGSPKLTWSSSLAASALAWAKHNAAQGYMEHSSGANAGYYGENIAVSGTTSPPVVKSYTQYVGIWGAEKANYIHRPFGPAASKTGSTKDIGHYTAVVWKKTTQCGCGKAASSTPYNGYYWEFFVCQYLPTGNIIGQYAY